MVSIYREERPGLGNGGIYRVVTALLSAKVRFHRDEAKVSCCVSPFFGEKSFLTLGKQWHNSQNATAKLYS
jgi:hypothetical protein